MDDRTLLAYAIVGIALVIVICLFVVRWRMRRSNSHSHSLRMDIIDKDAASYEARPVERAPSGSSQPDER